MIRQATANDLDEIAKVHTKCFPYSFSTALCGRRGLLQAFYNEYLKDVPDFLLRKMSRTVFAGSVWGIFANTTNIRKNF